ncbi:hypothetical protein GQ457_03G033150 [Hibiscus cannabinus]
MVSEIPVVRWLLMVLLLQQSGIPNHSPTSRSLFDLMKPTIFFGANMFLFTIESLDLSSHIDGTSVVPSQYVLVNGEKVPNPHFASFKQHDSALCSWLLASISLSILPSLVSCRTAFEIWEKVQQIFSVSNPLSETMHISAILSGLPSEYEPVVALITSSQQPYKLDGVCGFLLDTEPRLQETHSANLVQNSNLGYDGYQFGSTRGGSNVFFDQSYYPFVGQVSSGAPNSISQKAFSDSRSYSQSPSFSQNPSFSQRVYQTPSFFRGSGFQSGRSFSRGGRGRFFGGRSQPQCQLCGRIGHLVNRCYYRFDQSYDGYSVNLVEEVADCPKAEGESFHQEGAEAFVSEDFSHVVCEDAAWFPDSGATAHLTPDLGKFITSSPYTCSGKITVANGMVVPISHIGRSSLATDSRSLFLSNLLHVPCVNKNLLSVSRFTKDNNVSVEFFPNSCVVKDLGTQQVMLRGLENSCQDDASCNKLSSTVSKSVASIFSVIKPVVGDVELWHRRLDKTVVSSLVENFRFPKLSLVSKSVQDSAGYSSTSHVPPPLSSEFKFPAKLLVYQRRPKVLLPDQQVVSSSTSNQQPESLFCQYNELLPSQQTGSLFLTSQQPQSGSSQQRVGSHLGRQECFVRETSNTQEVYKEVSEDVSEVSQGSSSSAVSNIKAGCHPMLTRSKTSSLKNKVCFSAVASMEIAEPKTVQQALAMLYNIDKRLQALLLLVSAGQGLMKRE